MQALLERRFSGETFDYRFVFALLGPVVMDQFFLVSFNFLNTAMISGSGESAISAVNMVGTLNVFIVQTFVAIGLGGTVLIAQYFGKHALLTLGAIVNGTIYLAIFSGTLFATVAALLRTPLLHLLFGAAQPQVLADAELYLLGIVFSYPFEAVIAGISGCLRGVSKTGRSLQLSLVMNALYLALNVWFILILHWGVAGMALGLNLSRWVGCLFARHVLGQCRDVLHLQKKRLRHVDWPWVKRVLTVSLPFAAESIFFNGGRIIVQMMIVALGTSSIVAFAIAGSWSQLSEIIPTALQNALVPIVGQCMGRKNVADAKKITLGFLGLGVLAYVVVDGLLLLVFHRAIWIFHPAAGIVPLIFAVYCTYLVMHLLVWPASFILPSALRAAGDGKFTTYVSLGTMWLFRVAGCYLVGLKLGYGLRGIAVIMVLEWLIRALIFGVRFRGKRWYCHEVTKQ
ncbi:MATE family efflux transporter [Lacticaseibacillus baoqingensis]|uniref:Probable multidrug resistance protein NorM n=1 Tax=Lacticaseibacillus baoqingensis TaxID=2486013 RepID=A0ABW4E6W8_9LACO|nr:MATE family efflux transporter [Lacticaseibacillus baoqingensis]